MNASCIKTFQTQAFPRSLCRCLETSAEDRAIVFIEHLFKHAISSGASDIHLEPECDHVIVRYSIDGVLQLVSEFDKVYWSRVCARIKVISEMDIVQTHKPQSGRVSLYGVDFRISCHPTMFGENIVIRVLDKSKNILELSTLGFNIVTQKKLHSAITRPNGMIIVAGPTGAGKTTTIHALLSMINDDHKNIMTLEDPPEIMIPGIRHTSVEGIGFFEGLKSILRQNPSVIFIGEIRDEQTAHLAFRASMTGSLVITTLHAKTSLHALQRLQDLEVPKSYISENVIGILSQRLVRKICCGGCVSCMGKSGYNGRTILSEWIEISDNLLTDCSSIACRKELLEKQGVCFMESNAKELVMTGVTSAEEISRVL
jgi:type II secretory ATPase GspE/PulE/Tfp pilus assembly ATPase PilB-like protein